MNQGSTAAPKQPSHQQMSGAPQAQMPLQGGAGNNNSQHHQMNQMSGNPYGGYVGQQQPRSSSMNMSMQGNGYNMHQGQTGLPPNQQGHRNSIGGSVPPPMNMGHQYPNQGGYNPNFNQQGMSQQQQQQQQQSMQQQFNQMSQQHRYPPQAQMQMPNQQQMQQQQHALQRQNSGYNSQQGHPNQKVMQPPYPQQHNTNNNYVRQSSSTNTGLGNPSSSGGQGSSPPSRESGGGGPLNYNEPPQGNSGKDPASQSGSLTPQSGSLTPSNPAQGGPGGDYGQQYLPSGLNGDWQSDQDMHHRREMIQHIVKLLKQKDKKASPEWLTKLPQMVKQLEVSLYRSAPSFEAYSDTSTLKMRLQQLAMEIAKKTQQGKDGSAGDGDGSNEQQQQQSSSSSRGQSHRNSSGNVDGGGAQQQQGSQSGFGGGSFNMTSSSSRGGASGGGKDAPNDEMASNQHGNPNDPDWKVRIRHKQQRLLLLHHSSKCKADDNKCKVTPYCGEMKKLWKHMARCTDNECRIPHCFSSRSILSHYRKCKDPRCPACSPVRETVRKTQRSHRSTGGGGGDVLGGFDYMSGGRGGGNHDPGMIQQPNNGMMNPSQMNNDGMMGPPQQMSNGMMQQGNDQMMGGPVNGNNMHNIQSNAMNNNMYHPGQQNQMPPQTQSSRHQMSNRNMAMPHPSSSSNGASNSRREKPESDTKARHKRQRLLLLRHASKCTAEDGTCTITPHCSEMKVLWKHIAACKDSYCKVRHCMSSRYVLSHYRRCKPPCDICDPVKEIIKNGFNHIEVDPAIMGDGVQSSLGTRATPPIDNTMQQPSMKRPRVDKSGGMMPPQHAISSGAPYQYPVAPPQRSNQQQSTSSSSDKPANPSEDHALLECFTVEQVKTHIQSLKKTAKLAPNELKNICLEVLKGLQAHEHGWVFATPVNPVELGLDDYFDIIKKPMDLSTIQKKLDAATYHSFDDFRSDVRLTFENAMKYNEEHTVVHEMAKELKKKFETDFKKLMKQLDKEHAENAKKVQACGLCGCEKRNFEPPVYFCNGANCPTKRIRRNTHFFITADKQYAWCNQCFSELKGDAIDVGVTKVKKADLAKRKNDEVQEESWVQCDDCERWIHQICGLYNTRHDKENTAAYSCPLCLMDKRKKSGGDPPKLPEPPSANDIPRTKLTDWLEKAVHKKVNGRIKELAQDKADMENISFEKAYKALSAGGPLTIRQVTSTDRKHEVRDLMKERYAHKSYPDEFNYRCKCIVVFQNIDGVDVVLFALYVYEHGDDSPSPNKKTVYVSYLDSVHFMKPRKMRTFIYHEILISYLDYARSKGYEQAFIWACPPLKGDDYIFYAKPEDQKTPKDVRLRQWYLDMLEDCQKRDIVGKVTNMFDEYFNDESLDAADVPYFEGDYFPGEAENIIKELNDENKKSGGKKKGASKGKKSGEVINGSTSSNGEYSTDGGRDPVMLKFCEAISGMKESFIVAFLNCKDAKPENLVVPKEIEEYRESNKLLENVKSEESADGTKARSGSITSDKQVDRFGRPIRVLDDDTEEIDSEFFNTRQGFLDLCRGNHYQFDELRRAKHTSMMVLWHLQNREAPKFVQQCFACAREISSGVRHHCSVCPDFDLCHDCFRDPQANRGQCNHKLEVVKVDTGAAASGLTEEQRKERQRNIQLHIALIEHASRCQSSKCTSSNCAKMKSYLKHGQVCKIKASGGCKVCKRIWTLLRIHAQQCKSSSCPIPQCIAIRKRIRQLQMKQRAMDDRRRQEMNRHYRMGQMQS